MKRLIKIKTNKYMEREHLEEVMEFIDDEYKDELVMIMGVKACYELRFKKHVMILEEIHFYPINEPRPHEL